MLDRETRRKRMAILNGVFALLLTAATVAPSSSRSAEHAAAPILSIESVRLTAAGHYLDLRYRVLDAVRANSALGPGIKPLLIDEASGAVMAVPTTAKLGSLRQTQAKQKTDRTYFVMFVNTARIGPGTLVTAKLGELQFEHLTVQ